MISALAKHWSSRLKASARVLILAPTAATGEEAFEALTRLGHDCSVVSGENSSRFLTSWKTKDLRLATLPPNYEGIMLTELPSVWSNDEVQRVAQTVFAALTTSAQGSSFCITWQESEAKGEIPMEALLRQSGFTLRERAANNRARPRGVAFFLTRS